MRKNLLTTLLVSSMLIGGIATTQAASSGTGGIGAQGNGAPGGGGGAYNTQPESMAANPNPVTPTTGNSTASAETGVTIKNMDSKSYNLKIHDSGKTTRVKINPQDVQQSACTNCQIEVAGIGSFNVGDKREVIIRNGSVETQ